MPDSTTEAIDRFFDAIDKGVSTADRVLNRAKYTEEQLETPGPKRSKRSKRAETIDVEAAEHKPNGVTKPAPTTAIARKVHFYIVESITPAGTLFVVTDGGSARTECSTRAFAEKILRALEGAQ